MPVSSAGAADAPAAPPGTMRAASWATDYRIDVLPTLASVKGSTFAAGVADDGSVLVGVKPDYSTVETAREGLLDDGSGAYVAGVAGARALSLPTCMDGAPRNLTPIAFGAGGTAAAELICLSGLGSRSRYQLARWPSVTSPAEEIGDASVMSGSVQVVAVNAAGSVLAQISIYGGAFQGRTYVVGPHFRHIGGRESTESIWGESLADDGTVVGHLMRWDEQGPSYLPVVSEKITEAVTALPVPAGDSLRERKGNFLISPDGGMILRNGEKQLTVWGRDRKPRPLAGTEGFSALDINSANEVLGTVEGRLAIWQAGIVRQIDVKGIPADVVRLQAREFNNHGQIAATLTMADGTTKAVLLTPSWM
ncbi:hypothetical protein [Austwickia chelonae]|nr:hypothetical protein [Austwickia chelonae]